MNTNNQIIYLENGAYSKVKKALKQWIDLYIDQLDEKLTFKIYKLDKGQLIKLNHQIKNELFFYLVNYLKYPEDINYNVRVRGYTTLKNQKLFPKEKLNQQLEVYIPTNDTKYDIVHVVTKSKVTFEIDFNGNSNKINSTIKFDKPNSEYHLSKPEVLKIKRRETLKNRGQKTIDKFNFRYILIIGLYVIGVFLYINIFSKSNSSKSIVDITSFGLLLWLILEFELLQHKIVYFKLLLLAIILAFFEFYFKNKLELEETSTTYTRMALCFLILHQFLRHFYVKIFHKEPEFGRDAEKLSDILFTAVVLFVTFYVGGIWS